MRCPAEREVPVVLARDVEAIGLREAFWVAVSRCHHGDCGLPFANLLPSKFQIVRCETRGVLARRLITEHFLYSGRYQREIGLQSLEFLWMSQQRKYAVSNQIRGCLLATNHRDDSVCDGLFFGKTISVDFRCQEGLNESFSRMLLDFSDRSEERRVGKECICRLSRYS